MRSVIDAFPAWIETLESRYLADLRFTDVTRALRALSSASVERRAILEQRSVFATSGKRAAFALYYLNNARRRGRWGLKAQKPFGKPPQIG